MTEDENIEQIQQFAKTWNELYQAEKFDQMMDLACVDVGIANAKASTDPSGLIFGRENYKKGIVDTYYGSSGKEHNLLVMQWQGWEYIRLDDNQYYTIGRYTLEPNYVGVNCWLLRREHQDAPWRIYRVINN